MDTPIIPKAITAFAGRRDDYQLPIALHENSWLQTLVTELYWPADRRRFSSTLGRCLPSGLIKSRFDEELPSERVTLVWPALGVFAVSRITGRTLHKYSVKALSKALHRAVQLHPEAAVFSHAHYAYQAFRPGPDRPQYRFLSFFSIHPVAARQLYTAEIERCPAARQSLMNSAEMRLSAERLQELSDEARWANGTIAPTRFVARTLIEHGTPPEQIHVVPYGVDTATFSPRREAPSPDSPFTVSFAGSVIQAKGIIYLLEALRQLQSRHIQLRLFSRSTVHEELLKPYADLNLEVQVGLRGKALAEQMSQADMFVFPSLAEGFGHVILENLACGVPVLATDHTCAPDVFEEYQHGFIVPIRSAEAIAERIAWGVDHRAELAEMGEAASRHALRFTWAQYRENIRHAYCRMIEKVEQCT